jgi:deazaflavin-dependent oxidoreductase (nitroreductase family)
MKPEYRRVPSNSGHWVQLGGGSPIASITTIRIAVRAIGPRIRPFFMRALDQAASGAGGRLDKKEAIMDTYKHIGRQRLFGICAVVVVGLVVIVAAVLASPVVMPRIIRRHPDWLKSGIFRRYADFRRRHAGRRHSITALLTHVGRRSRTTYQTPVGAQPYGDGFVVSLPYGSTTDWCRNVMAAGTCTLAWKGQTYGLERPEIISGSQVFPALPVLLRIVVRGDGTHDFLWLHHKEANTGNRADIAR